MKPIHLAFLWHQHQPFYKDVLRHRYVLPWVRLHALKSYTGLLLALKEFPQIRANVNLVPSLIVQIEEYAEGRAMDHALRLTRKPATELTESDRLFILDHFFAGNPTQTVRPFARYREMYDLRAMKARSAEQALPDFNTAMFRDLQVWATLAWFHPLVVDGNPVLQELRQKGRAFTEEDKRLMLHEQDAVLRRLLPLHREMAETGQIELSTTPFYHPILPLLCRMECAREGLPGLPMPEKRADFAPDAEEHVQRAIELHERVFGRKPLGMWPAEGSVGMDILPLLRGRGFRWIATDEQILARSTGANLARDQSASLLYPDALYQPYALPGDDLPAIVFRDRGLSDAIGFEYHHGDSVQGAENLAWRIVEGGRRCHDDARLISVILDGENPWDYYPQAGVPFLRALFDRLSRLTQEGAIASTTLSDYIERRPPQNRLERLHAGSWIEANFAIWIGTPDDRAAWSLVAEAREALMRRMQEEPPLDPRAAEMAREELLVAEGSDWCWWLGGDRTSDQDYLFDELFRNHVANIYHLIGLLPPAALAQPIGKPPKAAGRGPEEEDLEWQLGEIANGYHRWSLIGRYDVVTESSTMRRATEVVRRLYYGFGENDFFLRIDAENGALGALGPDARVAVRFQAPARLSLVSDTLSKPQPTLSLQYENGTSRAVGTLLVEKALGLACPVWLLASRAGDQIEFHVEILRGDELVQRVPVAGAIPVTVPVA